MKFFHFENGSINVEAIERISYSRPATMNGELVAEVVLMTGEQPLHFSGADALRIQHDTGYADAARSNLWTTPEEPKEEVPLS